MTDTYGALQAASNDAGSWTLIEQGDTGEWAPMARGGKSNIVKLAQLLNTAEALLEKQTDPAIRAANLEAVRDTELPPGAGEWTIEQQNMAAGSSTAITREEVESWDRDRYLQRRARLWVSSNGHDYRDGSEHGRPYTTPAARIMTGPRENHPSFNGPVFRPDLLGDDGRATLAQANKAAQTARDVAQTWHEGHGRGIQKDVRIAWPGLAAQLDKLAEQWADRGPAQP